MKTMLFNLLRGMRKGCRRAALSGLLLIATAAYGQDQIVTLPSTKTSVKTIVAAIEKQTGMSVDFSQGNLDPEGKITLADKRQTLASLLGQMLQGSGLEYRISGRHIMISRPDAGRQTAVKGGENTVKGVITDTQGEPIIGAAVRVKGSNTGVITDADGSFAINAAPEDRLEISYIGYKTMEVRVGSRGSLNLVLQEDRQILDEVVVVGYGTQKKVNLTGAVTVVDGEQLKDRPVANMTQLLQGSVPNMNISVSNGMPGNSGSINIRGIASVSGGGSPLILIDGVEGSINDVNPYDVESVSVLKDASSAAVYGARAAYGVILVTTKSGQDGKTHVSYSGMYGFGDLTTKHDFETRGYYSAAIIDKFFSTYQGAGYTTYNDEDYYELWIRRNDKTENPERPWVVTKNGQYKYYGNFDWFNYLFDVSRPTWQHNLTVNGGNKKTQWFLSGGFYSQDGAMRQQTDNFKKVNFRVKLKTEITPWMTLSNNTTYFRSGYKYPGSSGMNNTFIRASRHAPAFMLPYNPDGTATYLTTAINSYSIADGVSSVLEYGKNTNDDNHDNFQTTFETVLTPLRHFSLTANYTYYYQHYNNVNRSTRIPYSRYPGVVEYRTDIKDQLYERNQDWWYHGYNIFGTYENTFEKAHHLKLMGGMNYETQYYKALSAQRDDLLSEDLNDFNLAKGEQIVLNGGKTRYALLGFFYRLNYDYRGRYLFEASGRYDGSSRFPRHHRYGFFPSFSAGWRISEEPFFAPLRKIVYNAKLRLSCGSLGNQQVGYYDYLQVINSGSEINYSFGGDQKITGASASAPNSSDLTWEKVITYNAGLDLGFFNNRLSLTGDVYIRDTKDMLMAGKDLPAVYGAASPKANAANLRTRGYELTASWNDDFNLLGSPFHYGITLGFADSKTKITKYNNPNKVIGTFYEGEELGSIWGFVADGFFKTDEEARNYKVDQTYLNSLLNVDVIDNGLHAGDIRYVDLDGDGKITPTTSANDLKDRRIIGNSLPRWTYSGKIDLSWKGIGISAMWQGVVRQHWYPASNTFLFWGPYAAPYQSFIPTDFLSKVWSQENPNSYFPRPRGYVALAGSGGSREMTRPNTMYLQNAGYCRLKNLTISYTLPRKWLQAIHMETVRVYFSGENLFTLSGLDTKYLDPEMCGAGYSPSANSGHRDANGYPMSKTYSFGLNVTF